MPRKPKAQIESPEDLVADGKDNSETAPATKPKNLQELFGFNGQGGRYKTDNEEKYSEYLTTLGSADLRSHTEKVGLNWNSDRQVIKTRLVREFRKYWQQFEPASQEKTFSAATEAKIRKVLQGG